jgi:hypothetical protein
MNIKERAEKTYQRKLKLESLLKPKLVYYFATLKKAVITGHNLPTIAPILIAFNVLVVEEFFKGFTNNNYPDIKKKVLKENGKLVAAHIKSIDETSHKRLQSALEAAKEAHKEKVSNIAINKSAAQIFDTFSKKRILGIAITESSTLVNQTKTNILKEVIPVFIKEFKRVGTYYQNYWEKNQKKLFDYETKAEDEEEVEDDPLNNTADLADLADSEAIDAILEEINDIFDDFLKNFKNENLD